MIITLRKLAKERQLIDIINDIYEKFAANIILKGKIKILLLRKEQEKRVHFYHCCSTLYWKF